MDGIKLIYTPTFLRKLKKCEPELQEEIKERITLFKNRSNHKQLKVHKLKGNLKNRYSFSATYAHRIVFIWEDTQTAVLLSVGDHNVYK